jgi:hypothetical protein
MSVALHDKTRLLKRGTEKFLDRVIINLAVLNFNLIKKRFEASRFHREIEIENYKNGEADERQKKKSEMKMKLIPL